MRSVCRDEENSEGEAEAALIYSSVMRQHDDECLTNEDRL